MLDCVLDLLDSAKPLKNRAPVHLHAGTAEVLAEVRTLNNSSVIEPGTSTLVRIVLRDPLLLLPGDRFIIRMFSPVVTIGGGEVIDSAPPQRGSRKMLLERARRLADSSLPERIALLVSESEEGVSIDALIARTGLRSSAICNPCRIRSIVSENG